MQIFQVRRSQLLLRMALALAVVLVPLCLLLYGLSALLSDRTPDPAGLPWTGLFAALGGGIGAAIGSGQNLPWVRSSAAGLEWSGARRSPMFLPWSEVASVRRRFPAPFTQLVIAPATPESAKPLDPAHFQPQRLRRRGGELTYVVDIGMMSPGPAAVLAEVRSHL